LPESSSNSSNNNNEPCAINTCVVSLAWYMAGIINWRSDELEAMGRKTRKIMTIWYNSLHPRAVVDRSYLRKEEGRGLISIEEAVCMEGQNLSRYMYTPVRRNY